MANNYNRSRTMEVGDVKVKLTGKNKLRDIIINNIYKNQIKIRKKKGKKYLIIGKKKKEIKDIPNDKVLEQLKSAFKTYAGKAAGELYRSTTIPDNFITKPNATNTLDILKNIRSDLFIEQGKSKEQLDEEKKKLRLEYQKQLDEVENKIKGITYETETKFDSFINKLESDINSYMTKTYKAIQPPTSNKSGEQSTQTEVEKGPESEIEKLSSNFFTFVIPRIKTDSEKQKEKEEEEKKQDEEERKQIAEKRKRAADELIEAKIKLEKEKKILLDKLKIASDNIAEGEKRVVEMKKIKEEKKKELSPQEYQSFLMAHNNDIRVLDKKINLNIDDNNKLVDSLGYIRALFQSKLLSYENKYGLDNDIKSRLDVVIIDEPKEEPQEQIKEEPKEEERVTEPEKGQEQEQVEAEPQSANGDDKSTGLGLTNNIINKIMERSPHYIGTFSVDQLMNVPIPKDTVGVVSFVVNTMPFPEPGHWVAVIIDYANKNIEYYDSFGDTIPKDISLGIRRLIDNKIGKYQMKINRVQIQSKESDNCGFFATKFLLDRLLGRTFKQATHFDIMEKNIKDNEKDIKKFKDFVYKRYESYRDYLNSKK